MNFSMTLKQWRQSLARFIPRVKTRHSPKPATEKRKPTPFFFIIPEGGRIREHRVVAMTRSEARAQLKAKLGLKRLPAGATVRPRPVKEAA